MSTQFKYLFSPLKIGKIVVPNRISFSAHLTNFAVDCLPSEKHIYYYSTRARGGTGLIITEEQSVHPTDRAYEKLIEAFKPEVIPWYKKITRAVHEYETKIFAQLNHNGQQCSGAYSRLPVWAPSAIPDVLFRETPKEMEIEDIQEVIEYFCKCAIHVREGGFDGIELQFGHSSLVRQFMSPLTNFRTDEYGGSFENRMRFPRELLSEVRKVIGDDFTLGIRLCADEMLPWGGLTIKDAQEIAKVLEATGTIDFIDLTLGTFYNLYLVGGTMHIPLAYAVPLSSSIKEVVNIPVFATGRINDPIIAEKILANGQADMIGMVRAQICDPNLAIKAKEGKLEEIRYCIADNQNCYGRVGLNRPIGCAQNPFVGNEKNEDELNLPKTKWRKRIIVVGGGPSGMWAAKIATIRGHNVTLFEKEDHLGGQVAIAMKGAGREEFGVIIRNEVAQLKKLKVPVVLNQLITPEFILKEKPDAVIIATGSKPKRSPIPGSENNNRVFNVWQILKGEADIGERILFIDYDGHHQATSTAEYLVELGKFVNIVTPSLFVGTELGPTQDLYMSRQRLLQKGAKFTSDIAIIEIKDKVVYGINVYTNEQLIFSDFDTIVMAMGNEVEDKLYFSLKNKVEEIYRVGDCVAPRKVDMAIYEGYMVGRKI
ncbi:MAG: mycofactocin system FadH/OYE family oxidoreductase 2 [Candidatus Goldbacteria bacterium]|nr:mycofactocin system FadH/OYE family oxidoreductase 2 [Candidatus Goldiibacteriota bacterium]